MNFKYEEIPQRMCFLFLPPCLIENSIHCSSSKFLPSTIGPLSLRLGKGFWHNQQQGKCFNSSVNTATEVYCYQTDTLGRVAIASIGPPALLGDPPVVRAKSLQDGGLALRLASRDHRAQRFGVGESWVWVQILWQTLWPVASCLIFLKLSIKKLSILPGT